LQGRGVRPFYDRYEEVSLWGKDLYEHLDYVYQRAARYCVVFASADYARKLWTTHERRSAQARAIQENVEYILPARFDDTGIPGLRGTVGYIDLRGRTPSELAELIVKKLGPRRRKNYFPPRPDVLIEALELEATPEADYAESVAREVYRGLARMNGEERRLLFHIFLEGCASALPDNVHVSLDLLRRITKMPPAEIMRTLQGLGSLGVRVAPRRRDDHEGEDDMIEVRWENFVAYDDDEEYDIATEMSTEVARAMMLNLTEDYCMECAYQALADLDFSALARTAATSTHRGQGAHSS
jgi:hypothetical protein